MYLVDRHSSSFFFSKSSVTSHVTARTAVHEESDFPTKLSKMCTLLLAIAFLGGFSLNGVHGLAVKSRELDCTFPVGYSQSCLDSINQVTLSSSGMGTFAAVGSTLTLRAALEEACGPKCLDSPVEFYRCVGEEELAQAYESALCGKEKGLYCSELYIKGVADSIIPTTISSCARYNETIHYLGCCAASLFRNPEISNSFFPFNTFSFVSCYTDIDKAVGSRCPPPSYN